MFLNFQIIIKLVRALDTRVSPSISYSFSFSLGYAHIVHIS